MCFLNWSRFLKKLYIGGNTFSTKLTVYIHNISKNKTNRKYLGAFPLFSDLSKYKYGNRNQNDWLLNWKKKKFYCQWLTKWKRGGRLQKSERKSIRNRAQQHNEGPWEGQRHRQGGLETTCRSFKLQGWAGAIQCQCQCGHFLELSCIRCH